MSEGELVKRFGNVAVEKGFITPENLYEAVKIQTLENLEKYSQHLIGHVLLKLGYINTYQIKEVPKIWTNKKAEHSLLCQY